MAEQFGDKQHEATPHRRQKAREKGQVARSQDLSSAVLLLGALLVLFYFFDDLARVLGELCYEQLGGEVRLTTDPETLMAHWRTVGFRLMSVMFPVLGSLALLAAAVNAAQVGFLFLPEKLSLDVSKLSPIKGFQRLFSLSNVVRLGFGIVKVAVVALVAYWAVWGEREHVLALTAMPPLAIAEYVLKVAFWTCIKIGLALLLLAILDYAYQKWKHEQDLRMTTQELREELKTLQGDPQMAARRKAVQRQLAMSRLNQAVPEADVVVTNPTELAIAVRYDLQTMDAPVVVAKGAGVVAQRIRRLALEHNIPIVERKELARALYKNVEVGQPIPPDQYAAMAEVLRYVYELQGRSVPDVRQAA